VRKTVFFAIILFSLIQGCSRKVNIPEDVLSPENITAFLTDVHIAEAALTVVQHNGMDISYYKKAIYNHIYEKYDTDAETYQRSISFYAHNLKLFDEIQANVITELNKKQIELTVID